jgi:serine/threonine protein kinase
VEQFLLLFGRDLGGMHPRHTVVSTSRLFIAGAYGVVSLCVDRRTGREYACKVLPKVRGRLTPAKTAKKIWQEVELLSRVQSCGNVARLQSVFEDDERVYIVLELCQGGDLEQLLEVRLPGNFGPPRVAPHQLHIRCYCISGTISCLIACRLTWRRTTVR